ncbi:ABC transporter ATP-binding protein, partial [Myxococcota bacterium]|nr:ABC transporter ATP-binding protein [Myxococcota bacterium]
MSAPLLDVRGLSKTFPAGGGLFRRGTLRVLHDVSFQLARGEAVALVGESGSGKSTIARLLLRLMAPDRGELVFDGRDVLRTEPRRAARDFRRRVQMIFQDPFASLNPVRTVADHLERPLLLAERATKDDARAKVLSLLRAVCLDPAEDFADKHPHALSGGQRQRVAIARALAVEPELVVADEPTSMLDVSIRMGILNLLDRFKRERGISLLLITHDLASARYLADRVLVLYAGEIVEEAPVEQLLARPSHPYTRSLLAAVPKSDGDLDAPLAARPGAPNLAAPLPGCAFAPRCP